MSIDFITGSQIVDHFIEILQADDDLNEYLAEQGVDLLIFDHPNQFKPPSEQDAPFVAIYRSKIMKGEQRNEWVYDFEFEIGIVNEAETKENNVITQDGVRDVEYLGNLIYTTIKKGLSCNLGFNDCDIQIDETSHPLYIAYYGFSITVQKVIGTNITL